MLAGNPHSEGAYPLEPKVRAALIADLLEKRGLVALVGPSDPALGALLVSRGLRIISLVPTVPNVSAASQYSQSVEVIDLARDSIPALLSEPVSGVVLNNCLGLDAGRLLAEAATAVPDGGIVVATARNLAHGPLRIAFLKGDLSTIQGRHSLSSAFTLAELRQTFAEAGLALGAVSRLRGTLVGDVRAAWLHCTDLERQFIEQVARDEDAETLEFLASAIVSKQGSREQASAASSPSGAAASSVGMALEACEVESPANERATKNPVVAVASALANSMVAFNVGLLGAELRAARAKIAELEEGSKRPQVVPDAGLIAEKEKEFEAIRQSLREAEGAAKSSQAANAVLVARCEELERAVRGSRANLARLEEARNSEVARLQQANGALEGDLADVQVQKNVMTSALRSAERLADLRRATMSELRAELDVRAAAMAALEDALAASENAISHVEGSIAEAKLENEALLDQMRLQTASSADVIRRLEESLESYLIDKATLEQDAREARAAVLTSELEAQGHNIERARLEREVQEAKAAVATFELEVQGYEVEKARLECEVQEAHAAVFIAERAAQGLEDAWFELYAEYEGAAQRASRREAQLRDTLASADQEIANARGRGDLLEAALKERSLELASVREELNDAVERLDSAREVGVGLTRALEELEAMRRETDAWRAQCAALSVDEATARLRALEIEGERDGSRQALEDLTSRFSELEGTHMRVQRAYITLCDQAIKSTNEEIGQAQAEIARISAQIDATQASRVWAVKRFLLRIFGRHSIPDGQIADGQERAPLRS